jgi:NTP pyrophosphatase (non-canonical NTP hydrolase)
LKNKVLNWAGEKGILEKASPESQMLKTVEEIGELANALGKRNKEEIMDAIGDIAITLIIQARLCGLDFDDCVESAYNIIALRTGRMVNGIFVKDTK